MQPLCRICCNPKRKLRFHTEHLAICQWCVTELSNADTSPSIIIEERRSSALSKHRDSVANELRQLRRLLTPPPQVPTTALEQAVQYAESAVRRDGGIVQSLYRSMINDRQRRNEITVAAARREAELLAKHRDAANNHAIRKRVIEFKIQAVVSRNPQIPQIVELELQRFLSEAGSLEPTKSKEVRLLRALEAGLISLDRAEHARPALEEYEEQKRRIRARDSFRCVCCLRGFAQGELHVHHVLPLSRFGTNADLNLATLCHPCHKKQHPSIKVTRFFPIKRRAATSIFVAVDIETTGLSNDDSIIEIAAARFVDGRVEEVFSSLVRTKRSVPAMVTRLTGITQLMISDAPHPEVVIQDFVDFVSNHRLIFHNASFDMRYIEKYLTYFNHPTPRRILDTLPIARKKLPQLPNHRLTYLVEHFEIPISRSHRAREDSIATGQLYLALREVATPRAKAKRKNGRVSNSTQRKGAATVRRDV